MALAALGVLLWRAWTPAPSRAAQLVVATTSALPASLSRALRAPLGRLDLTVDSVPGARDRAWLRALASAGTIVRWRRASDGAAPAPSDTNPTGPRPWLASVTIEPLADPSGRVRLVASGASDATIALDDAAGSLDSARLGGDGARALEATVAGVVVARTGGSAASSARRDSMNVRPLLVLARAGWEGKFTVAALEEAGWRVEARFSVAPQATVQQGARGSIDTARYAAVIALDASVAPQAAAIVRFVRSGGGVILAPGAASVAGLSSILPARVGIRVAPTLGALASEVPRRALGGVAFAALRPDALVLETLGGVPRVVAARVDAGRVLLLGFDETWHWRMEGEESGPAGHRTWWSSMAGSVAHAPAMQLAAAPAVDEAPYAALVEALGARDAESPFHDPLVTPWLWHRLIFALLLAALLTEWGLRRARGAR